LLLCSYKQALDAVNVGRAKLAAFGIPIERPEDYFAEMVKTDEHMRKVC
jgi:rRNA-processing protein EBP2